MKTRNPALTTLASQFSLLAAFWIATHALPRLASAAEYTVDKSHSRIGFQVRHLFSKVSGEFKDFEGDFNFDPEKLDSAKANVTIQASSINTNEGKRDEHLRSPDFLDTGKFPTVSFVSKKLKADGNQKYKLEGDFTLHGVTKPVTFDVEFLGKDKDPWGNQRAGFTASAIINRKDFGVQWNKVLESGRVLVGDEINVTVEVEGIQKAAPGKK